MPFIQRLRRLLADRRGANMVEFAILTPVLLTMTLGATDFARIFIESHAMAGASNSGSSFGARRNIDSVNFTEMQNRALGDLAGGDGATATASMFCDCPQNPGVSVSCLSGSCPNYGKPRVYVKTSVERSFSTWAKYPGIKRNTSLKSKAWMRVQ